MSDAKRQRTLEGDPSVISTYGSHGLVASETFNTNSPGQNYSSSIQSPPSAGNRTLPVAALSPFSGSKWNIIARVTYKSDLLPFRNGSGNFFTLHLLDVSNTEIRCTFYTDAAERHFECIEFNKVYKFSSAKVKDVSDRRYTSIKNKYDLTFDANSIITEEIDNGEIKEYTLNTLKIANLASMEANKVVDIMGFVRNVSAIQSYQALKRTSQKRDLCIFDDSGEVRVTLWDNLAESVEADLNEDHVILAIKNVKVSEYLGRSLSTTSCSSLVINPAEGDPLRQWLQDNICNIETLSTDVSLSTKSSPQKYVLDLEHRVSIKYILDNSFAHKEDGDIVSLKVSITHLHHDRKPWYSACPTKGCNKKVIEISGIFHCSKCCRDFQDCVQRYILSCVCSDYTGQLTLTLYNEQAEKLLGHTANQLSKFLEDDNVQEYENCYSRLLFKSFIVVARLNKKVMKDDFVLETTVLHLENMKWGLEGAQLYDYLMK